MNVPLTNLPPSPRRARFKPRFFSAGDAAILDDIPDQQEQTFPCPALSYDARLRTALASYGIAPEGRLLLALKSASTEQLKTKLVEQITEADTPIPALRISAELTARGIAPRFRDIPLDDVRFRESWEVDWFLLLIDLQWIVTRYPIHVPEWLRLRALFDPRKFGESAKYLYWDGNRTPGQIVHALALTERQQLECVWTQSLHVGRWWNRLSKRVPIARSKIEAAIRANDLRPTEEQDETIRRRTKLWQCAELAGWKPQRTSAIYFMMTGETLSRSLVANQLAKLPKVRRADEVISL